MTSTDGLTTSWALQWNDGSRQDAQLPDTTAEPKPESAAVAASKDRSRSRGRPTEPKNRRPATNWGAPRQGGGAGWDFTKGRDQQGKGLHEGKGPLTRHGHRPVSHRAVATRYASRPATNK